MLSSGKGLGRRAHAYQLTYKKRLITDLSFSASRACCPPHKSWDFRKSQLGAEYQARGQGVITAWLPLWASGWLHQPRRQSFLLSDSLLTLGFSFCGRGRDPSSLGEETAKRAVTQRFSAFDPKAAFAKNKAWAAFKMSVLWCGGLSCHLQWDIL